MLPPSEDAHSNSNVGPPDSSSHNGAVSSHLSSLSSRSSSPNLTVVVDTLTSPLAQESIHKNNLSVLSNGVSSNRSSCSSGGSTSSNGNGIAGQYHQDDSIVRANFVDFTLDISDNNSTSSNTNGNGHSSFGGGLVGLGVAGPGRRSSSGSATVSSSGDPAEEEEDEDEDKDFYNLSLNPDLHKIRAEQIRNWLEYENNHSNSNSLVSGSHSGGELGDESRDFEEDSLNLHDVVNLAGRNRRVRFLTDQEGNLLISVFLTNMIDDEEQQRLQALSQNQQNENNAEPAEVEVEVEEESASSTSNGHSTPETLPIESIENGASDLIEPQIDIIDVNNNSPAPVLPDGEKESADLKTVVEESAEIIKNEEESPPLVFIVNDEARNEPNYAAMDKNMDENIMSASSSDMENTDNGDSDNETDQEPELVKLTEDLNETQEFSDSETLSASSSCDSMIEIIPGTNRPIAPAGLSLKDEMEMEYNDEISKIMDSCENHDADNNHLRVPDISLSSIEQSLSPVQESPAPDVGIDIDTNNNARKVETICYDEADKSMTCFEFNPETEKVIVTEPENVDAAIVVHAEPKEDVVKDIETEIAKLEREIEEEIKGRTENANLKFNPIIDSAPEPEPEKSSAEPIQVDIQPATEEKVEVEAIINEPPVEVPVPVEINDTVLEEPQIPGEDNMLCPELVHEDDIREESPPLNENTEEAQPQLLNATTPNGKSGFEISAPGIAPEPELEINNIAEEQLESLCVEEEPISSVALQIAKWESMAKKAPPKSIGSSHENLHTISNGSNKGKLCGGNLKGNNKNGLSPKPEDCPTKSTVWNCWNKANKGADDEEIIYAQPNNNTVMMTSLSNPSAVLKSHPKPSSRGEILNWFKDGEIHRAGLIISNNNTFGIHHSTINNNNSDGSPANIPVVVSWFFGLITRVQAEKFLHGQPTGTFLVRISTRIWGYTLSYQSNQRTKHFLISAQNPAAVPPSLQTEKDKSSSSLLAGSKNLPKPLLSPFASQGRYAFIGTNMTPYTTLASLIRHHSHAPITKSGGEKLLFPCPGGPNLTGVEYLFK